MLREPLWLVWLYRHSHIRFRKINQINNLRLPTGGRWAGIPASLTTSSLLSWCSIGSDHPNFQVIEVHQFWRSQRLQILTVHCSRNLATISVSSIITSSWFRLPRVALTGKANESKMTNCQGVVVQPEVTKQAIWITQGRRFTVANPGHGSWLIIPRTWAMWLYCAKITEREAVEGIEAVWAEYYLNVNCIVARFWMFYETVVEAPSLRRPQLAAFCQASDSNEFTFWGR